MKDKIEILKRKVDEADAIIVGTASGMSAASGLRFYQRIGNEEHWALLLRTIKHLYEVKTSSGSR